MLSDEIVEGKIPSLHTKRSVFIYLRNSNRFNEDGDQMLMDLNVCMRDIKKSGDKFYAKFTYGKKRKIGSRIKTHSTFDLWRFTDNVMELVDFKNRIENFDNFVKGKQYYFFDRSRFKPRSRVFR